MQFTIQSFSQERAIEHNLDLVDLTILQWFKNFENKKSFNEDGITYYWLRYETLIKDLPILKIQSKDVLRRRLKKLVDKKILIHKCLKKGGAFSYYAFGEEFSSLVSNGAEKGSDNQRQQPSDNENKDVSKDGKENKQESNAPNNIVPLRTHIMWRGLDLSKFDQLALERMANRFPEIEKLLNGEEIDEGKPLSFRTNEDNKIVT